MQTIIEAGYTARANNELRAPGANATVIAAIGNAKVGDGTMKTLAEAFNQGWMRHEAEELAELMAA